MESESTETMKLGDLAHAAGRRTKVLGLAAKAVGISLGLLTASQAALAAAPAAAGPAAAASSAAVAGYVPMAPTPGKGMPVDGGIGLQDQYSNLANYAQWIHDGVLMPIIAGITILVMVLLFWVIVRYNRRANPTPSKTSHNTMIEVIWTLVPVLILVGIAVPSIDLLAKQYQPAPEKALTIKATGNQWFWTYSYPDNGDFEVTSYMLNIPGQTTINNGVREVGSEPWDGPSHLEVDYRMVVPVGEKIRLQVTASDVIHSFAIPSLWFKIDAVPGRINERVIEVDEPGVYYGQCSELCGAKHGYMPIVIEALPRDKYNAWVLTQSGGAIDGQPAPADDASAAPAAAASPAPAADASAAPSAAASAAASASPAPAA